jgi:hypothetical protein
MKLPSLLSLINETKRVFLRFPFEIVSAIIGTAALLYLVELDEYKDQLFEVVLRIALVSNLSLLLFLSGTFIHESNLINKWIIRGIAFLIIVLLFFSIHPIQYPIDYFFFFLISAALHLLVSFSPYLKGRSVNAFWQFNKNLFLRFLTSALYSAVIFIGLSLAILAITELFDISFDDKIYFKLWIIIAGIFNTVFFLAGIPGHLGMLEEESSYPKGLKTFTQYVLLPLVTIYLVILLLYEVKIMVLWSLPTGWVSNLIIAYGIFGILSILLVFPIREQAGNKWIKIFSKSFYYLLIPLIGLMYLAILKRISDYGFTESRYLVMVVGVWLTFITLYFIFSKKQNIKIIPVSLFMVTVLSAIGPQSAFNVSRHSQRAIIKNIFEKNNFLSGNKIRPLSKNDTLAIKDAKKVTGALSYLIKTHGINSLEPLFDNSFDTLRERINNEIKEEDENYYRWTMNEKIKKQVMNYMNIHYDGSQFNDYYTFYNQDNAVSVDGYDFYCSPNYYSREEDFHLGTDTISISKDDNKKLTVSFNEDLIHIDLMPLFDTLYKKIDQNSVSTSYTLNSDEMDLIHEDKKYKVRIIIRSINFDMSSNKKYEINFPEFDVLIKKL